MKRCFISTRKALPSTVVIVLFLIVTLMSACAVAPVNKAEKMLYKPNITQQEYAKDRFECMKESQQTKYQAGGATGGGIFYEPGQAKSEVITNRELYDLCMQARGYRFTEGTSLPSDFTGRAPFTYGNGDTYDGDWVNDRPHGKGTSMWVNGTKYEGDWINGNLQGRGIYTYPNGDKYEGEFFDDRFTGRGTFTCANGKPFTGRLENKKPSELTVRCN